VVSLGGGCEEIRKCDETPSSCELIQRGKIGGAEGCVVPERGTKVLVRAMNEDVM